MATGYSLISALRQQKETHFSRYAMEWSLVMTLSLTLSLCLSLLSHLRLPPLVSVRLLWVKECLWLVMSVFTVPSLSLSRSLLSVYLFILISSRSHSAVAEVGEYVCLDKTQTHKAILQEFSLDPLSLFHHTHVRVREDAVVFIWR